MVMSTLTAAPEPDPAREFIHALYVRLAREQAAEKLLDQLLRRSGGTPARTTAR